MKLTWRTAARAARNWSPRPARPLPKPARRCQGERQHLGARCGPLGHCRPAAWAAWAAADPLGGHSSGSRVPPPGQLPRCPPCCRPRRLRRLPGAAHALPAGPEAAARRAEHEKPDAAAGALPGLAACAAARPPLTAPCAPCRPRSSQDHNLSPWASAARVRAALACATPRRTRCAVAAAAAPSTSRRAPAARAATPPPRSASVSLGGIGCLPGRLQLPHGPSRAWAAHGRGLRPHWWASRGAERMEPRARLRGGDGVGAAGARSVAAEACWQPCS